MQQRLLSMCAGTKNRFLRGTLKETQKFTISTINSKFTTAILKCHIPLIASNTMYIVKV